MTNNNIVSTIYYVFERSLPLHCMLMVETPVYTEYWFVHVCVATWTKRRKSQSSAKMTSQKWFFTVTFPKHCILFINTVICWLNMSINLKVPQFIPSKAWDMTGRPTFSIAFHSLRRISWLCQIRLHTGFIWHIPRRLAVDNIRWARSAWRHIVQTECTNSHLWKKIHSHYYSSRAQIDRNPSDMESEHSGLEDRRADLSDNNSRFKFIIDVW